jgi:hypothetical protein
MNKPKKILLLGEYSNLHNNLSLSLREYGISSFVVGSPNGFRGLKADLSLSSRFPGILGRVDTALKPILNLPKLLNYDVVQAISYQQFHPLINDELLKLIASSSNKFCSLCTGCSSLLNDYLSTDHPYKALCQDCLIYDQKRSICVTREASHQRSEFRLYENSAAIIPMGYEYREAMLSSPFSSKVTQVHRYPFWTDKKSRTISRRPRIDKSVLKVGHGLNRYGFKGTKIVEEVKNVIRDKRIEGIEIRVLPRLSLENYLKEIDQYDVVIDQLYAESYGYNALYLMSMGMPIISATTQRALSAIGTDLNPFINVTPSPSDLLDLLLRLKENQSVLNLHMEMGFEFIDNVHSPDQTIPQFLQTWSLL